MGQLIKCINVRCFIEFILKLFKTRVRIRLLLKFIDARNRVGAWLSGCTFTRTLILKTSLYLKKVTFLIEVLRIPEMCDFCQNAIAFKHVKLCLHAI